MQSVVSSKLMAGLSGLMFLQRITIRKPGSSTGGTAGTVTRDAAGNPRKGAGTVATATNIPGGVLLENIPCSLSELDEEEKHDYGGGQISSHSILLKGLFEGITAGMSAVIDGRTYNILEEGSNSLGTYTRLIANTMTR